MRHPTFYRTIRIDGSSIFYREAGPKDAPALLLLHGLPSSDRFHLLAPDYPSFGHSDWPDPKQFPYTFDRYAVGFRMSLEGLGANWGLRRVFTPHDQQARLRLVQDFVVA